MGDLVSQLFDLTKIGWDHMEKNWLTEVVVSADGDCFMFGFGPMIDIGLVSFNAPLLFTLENKGIADSYDLAPRFDLNFGKFLIQSWSDVVFSAEVLDSWSSDNRILTKAGCHKAGVNILTSSDGGISITTAGILHQYQITDIFSVCSFVGRTDTNESAAWVKIKFFIP